MQHNRLKYRRSGWDNKVGEGQAALTCRFEAVVIGTGESSQSLSGDCFVRAELLVLEGPPDCGRVELFAGNEDDVVTLGRSSKNDVQIDDVTLSRQHLEVELQNGTLFLRDLNSKNGTLLNGQGVDDAVALSDGDRITAGNVIFQVQVSASADDSQEKTDHAAMVAEEGANQAPGEEADNVPVDDTDGTQKFQTRTENNTMPKSKITCPHCWQSFDIKDILAVSQHPELMGDSVLGPDYQQRFLPSRFTPDGRPIDAKGIECSDFACPRCHLVIPRSLTKRKPRFLSMVGAPGSGKTYLLTSMVWQLRKLLPRHFSCRFSDADTISNEALNDYEDIFFNSAHGDELTALPKTEMQGHMYDRVQINDMEVRLPRPLIFSVEGLPDHPWMDKKPEEMEQTLVLYDNAGEHFQSGRDSAADPGTRHLVKSEGMFFVFDPTRNVEFRKMCDSDDPQMEDGSPVERQEPLLTEALQRIERHSGNAQQDLSRPFVVVVSKFDVWREQLDSELPDPWKETDNFPTAVLHRPNLRAISLAVREMLLNVTPELVATAESFSSRVLYLPTSALGHSPTLDESRDDSLLVRPDDIDPTLAEVPLLYMLGLFGMIPLVKGRKNSSMSVAEDLRRSGSGLSVKVPGEDHRITVPRTYAGGPVRCPESQKWFWLPK